MSVRTEPHPDMPPMDDWATSFYDSTYLAVTEALVTPQRTLAEVDLLEHVLLRERKDLPILDLCCGTGRHLEVLEKRGYSNLTGLDRFGEYLDQARTSLGPTVRLVEQDVRDLRFRSDFGVIYNFFNSLNIFDDDTFADVLHRVSTALVPGGSLLLEQINPIQLYALPADEWVISRRPLVVEAATWDHLTAQLWIERQMVVDDKVSRRIHAVRVYLLHELVDLLRAVDLRVDGVWGDVYANPYHRASHHLVLRATKTRPTQSLHRVK